MHQAGQDPTAMAGSQAQSFFQYLHQQKSLFQQRQQQTADLLSPLSQSCSTESTSCHPLLNIPSDSPASRSTSAPQHTSPVRSLLPDADHWLSVQQNSNSLQFEHEEDELIDDDKGDDSDPGESTFRPFLEDMPTRSDFVNKLYKMLTDERFEPLVCWGPEGDCFVVKDMEACTKHILPRLFKHSNFSSFVRQLNKYSFRKIKSTGGVQYGENAWIFQHPYFRKDRPEILKNIIRKTSVSRKPAKAPDVSPLTSTPPASFLSPRTMTNNSTRRRASFAPQSPFTSNARPAINQNLVDRLTTLERNQEGLVVELIGMQRDLAERNELLHLAALSLQSPSGAKLLPSDMSCSNTHFEGYTPTFPSSFPPTANLGLEAAGQQPTANVMIQDPESPSLTSSNTNTFRLIQPSFDQVDWSSLLGQQ